VLAHLGDIGRLLSLNEYAKNIAETNMLRPRGMQILTGPLDEVLDADLAKKMGDQLGIKVDILVGAGHMISKEKIADALKEFIGQISGDGVRL
jgi:hypothetical protein